MFKKTSYYFLFVFLVGCAIQQINQNSLSKLDKGISQNETLARIKTPPFSSQVILVNDRNILFDRYELNTGMSYSKYYLAYEGNKLIYWGYVSDFKRNQDASLVKAIELLELQNK
jgi:hypothetical protein